MQKGGAGWLGRGGRSGPGPVTGGPESRQGGRGEEKVGDAATVHGGASPAETPGQTHRDRQGSVGWALRPSPPVLPPATLFTHVQPTLPPSLSSRSLLLALCLDHYPRRPRPPSPLLPLTRSLTLAGSPPARPAPALPLPPLSGRSALAPNLPSVSASLHLWVSVPLWPSQICLLNLAPTPWPAQQTPRLARPAPKQPPAFICRPTAGQKRPIRPAPCRRAPPDAPSP